jgi:hypothetical protein
LFIPGSNLSQEGQCARPIRGAANPAGNEGAHDRCRIVVAELGCALEQEARAREIAANELPRQQPERQFARSERIAGALGLFQQRRGTLHVAVLQQRFGPVHDIAHAPFLAGAQAPDQIAKKSREFPPGSRSLRCGSL